MGVEMSPWPDETFTRDFEPSQQPRNCVAVSIGPATDGVDRTGDRTVVLADGAMLPVVISVRMAEPNLGKEYRVFETIAPHGAPLLADDLRIRRRGVMAHEHRTPGYVFIQKATTHVMHVIEIAVICGTDRDDRLKLRRATGSHL